MESVGILLCALVFRHWDWTSNGALCAKGTRIILGWNHNDVDVMVLTQDDQAIHTRVWLKAEKKEVFCSFIYAHNHYTERLLLWKGLSLHKLYVHDRPWCLMGDFNASLSMEDISAGSSKIDISMREFKAFVDDIEVMDVNKSGLLFTWNQKPKGVNGILKKLDRMMANLDLVKKLKLLKKPLRKLMYEKGNLHANVIRLRGELDSIQAMLDKDPYNPSLHDYLRSYQFGFRGFFEKQKLTGPNFIDWYIQLRIVLSVMDKLDYLEQPIPPAPVSAQAGQQVAPEALVAHAARVKGSKKIAGIMLMTMEPEIQLDLENLSA
ncbi:RNA-directed DNA polymerase, eukaryota, reverse transcriptase zinc-binding domain protein [Tanacetum coccineum]